MSASGITNLLIAPGEAGFHFGDRPNFSCGELAMNLDQLLDVEEWGIMCSVVTDRREAKAVVAMVGTGLP